MTISKEAVEAAARAILEWPAHEEDPDNIDWSNEGVAMGKARASITAALPHLAPQPSQSDEGLAQEIARELFGSHFSERWPKIAAALAIVRAEEREACAKVADDHLIFEKQYGDDAGAGEDSSRSIAAAIRARKP